MSEFRYIVVDGLIRAGKTRLAQIISEKFNARLFCDNKENPFVEDFFSSLATGEDSVSLKTQLIFLLNRYSQQLEIKQKELFQKMTVSDYIFYRDGIYAHLILNDEELDIYKKMFNIFSENVLRSELVVYLQISFSEMLRRIRESGSRQEKNVPSEYWREVFEAYNYYFFNYKSSPLLVVNMEKVNLKNHNEVQQLVKEIKTHKKGMRYYAPA
ncbi:MAG: deoxynucleoside kinase [Candidatus Aminicenantes bacterium]|nr:deoxynucleoside kinase [Candidatus Aminicenantes bacterium]